jgi:hypothetical protein
MHGITSNNKITERDIEEAKSIWKLTLDTPAF